MNKIVVSNENIKNHLEEEKSTLIDLLCLFDDKTDGTILIISDCIKYMLDLDIVVKKKKSRNNRESD